MKNGSATLVREPVGTSAEEVMRELAHRVSRMETRQMTLRIELGPEQSWLARMSSATVRKDTRPTPSVDAEISVEPRVLARIMNGAMDPRHAVLFGHMRVKGTLADAVIWLDQLAGRRPARQEHYSEGVPLPSPTADRRLLSRQLLTHGYCIVSGVLTPGRLRSLKERLADQAAAERKAGLATFDGGPSRRYSGDGTRQEWWMGGSGQEMALRQPNQRLWDLHNKGQVFLDLLEHPLIDEFVPDFLGDHFLIAENSANIAGPGGEVMVLHQDQSGVQPPLPVAVGLNMMFCLDDFTEANGATRVIPGSHIAERGLAPDDLYNSEGTVATEAPAGSAILFESRIWHGTGANTTSELRHGLYLLFERSWMRTQHNGPLSVHPSVLEHMSDRAKIMYGHRVTGALGKVQGSREGDLVGWDPDQLVLEMTVKR